MHRLTPILLQLRDHRSHGRSLAIAVEHAASSISGLVRMDDVYLLDLRAEKSFAARADLDLTFSLELFNAFSVGTALSRKTTLGIPLGNDVLDVVSPRIWKLGCG